MFGRMRFLRQISRLLSLSWSKAMRFTIRELALCTVIAGLSVAWWMDHRWQLAQRRALAYENRAMRSEFESVRKNRDEVFALLQRAHAALQSSP
jgi:hypothetical protein